MTPGFTPATAAEFMGYFAEAIDALPHEWDMSSFWLVYAERLAGFIASQAGRFPADDAVMLVSVGGMLLTMARREQEAADLSALALDRAGKGGAA